jgi:hypothetical protein
VAEKNALHIVSQNVHYSNSISSIIPALLLSLLFFVAKCNLSFISFFLQSTPRLCDAIAMVKA